MKLSPNAGLQLPEAPCIDTKLRLCAVDSSSSLLLRWYPHVLQVQVLGSSAQQPTLSLTPKGTRGKCLCFKERTAPVCSRAKQNPVSVKTASYSERPTLRKPGPSVGKLRMVVTGSPAVRSLYLRMIKYAFWKGSTPWFN